VPGIAIRCSLSFRVVNMDAIASGAASAFVTAQGEHRMA
jgi:hypothetical protein